MSPLIDVTNIVVQDIDQINNKSCSINTHPPISNEVKKDSSSTSVYKNCSENIVEEINSSNNISKCTIAKHTHFKRKKQASQALKQEQNDPVVASSNEREINNRVPPIGCNDHLSQSLAKLSISEESKKPSVLTEKDKLCEEKPKCSQCACVSTGFLNNAEPPSGTCTGTYKCIACGLELSSIENLTNHLVKHVYEGLHAASWLNNAMITLLSQSPSNNLSTELSPFENQIKNSDVPTANQLTVTNINSDNKSENSSQKVSNSQT